MFASAFSTFAYWSVLFAQAEAQAPAAGAPQAAPGDYLSAFLPMILLFVVGYFLLISPSLKERKRQTAMIRALKKNDRVLTQSGIYGVVSSIDPERNKIVLKVDDDGKARVTFTLSSVAQVLNADAPDASAKPGSDAALS